MEKEFVPYELALELKQLGFDEPCLRYIYTGDTGNNYDHYLMVEFKNCNEDMLCISQPLYQQAFRWFREKHNIDAWVQPFVSEKQNGKPFLPDESYAYYIFEDGVYVADGVNFLDLEEAEMACLKKLIDHCKN